MAKVLVDNGKYLKVIYGVSILIPLVVAFLIFSPIKTQLSASWISFLPTFHAMVNSTTCVILISALVAIKKGNIKLHRNLMFTALILGVLFLISYILYHSTVDSVKFGDVDHNGVLDATELSQVQGTRTIYLVVLASHILLSILVVPFVLFAFYYALTDQVSKHKKLVKFTFPVWLYVSITGVIVYLMIKPYYL